MIRPRSEFSRHVVTLMTGSTIAQAIPLLISPILTRMYTPEEFGVYALFIALVSIFGTVATGRYELAIMLPDTDEDALHVLTVGLCITLIITFGLMLLVWGFIDAWCSLLHNEEIRPWLWFVPFVVLLMGVFNLLNYYASRKKAFEAVSTSNVVKAVVIGAVQIAGGWIALGAAGLISGQAIGQLVSVGTLFKRVHQSMTPFPKVHINHLWRLVKRYRKFPLFSMPAVLANVLSRYSIHLLISVFFNVATLGWYALAQRLLGIPSTLAGAAVGQVFYQKAVEMRKEGHGIATFFDLTVVKLFIAAVPLYALVYFMAEDLFALVFGETWRIAGSYAEILAPMFAIQFISASVALITSVYEKQLQSLWINMVLLGMSVGTLVASQFMGFEFETFLMLYSGIIGICYATFLVYYRHLSRGL